MPVHRMQRRPGGLTVEAVALGEGLRFLGSEKNTCEKMHAETGARFHGP